MPLKRLLSYSSCQELLVRTGERVKKNPLRNFSGVWRALSPIPASARGAYFDVGPGSLLIVPSKLTRTTESELGASARPCKTSRAAILETAVLL